MTTFTKTQIEHQLDEWNIVNYKIHDNLVVDVSQNVDISFRVKQRVLPFKFGFINGDFDCAHNQLTSLTNSPDVVYGSFFCGRNQLVSLQGAPKWIHLHFDCSDNKISSFCDLRQHITSVGSSHLNAVIAIPIYPVPGILNWLRYKTCKIHLSSDIFDDNEAIHVSDIINHYAQLDGDILKCQEALIDAGYANFAMM